MTSNPSYNKITDFLTVAGVTNIFYNTKKDTCLKYKKVNPDFSPKIYSLSINSALYQTYPTVYIYGDQFFPSSITKVKFGNLNVPIIYFNSSTISFTVPKGVFKGLYKVEVVNNITLKAITVTGVSNGISSTSNSVDFRIE